MENREAAMRTLGSVSEVWTLLSMSETVTAISKRRFWTSKKNVLEDKNVSYHGHGPDSGHNDFLRLANKKMKLVKAYSRAD